MRGTEISIVNCILINVIKQGNFSCTFVRVYYFTWAAHWHKCSLSRISPPCSVLHDDICWLH